MQGVEGVHLRHFTSKSVLLKEIPSPGRKKSVGPRLVTCFWISKKIILEKEINLTKERKKCY